MPNVTGSSGKFGGSAQAQSGKDKNRDDRAAGNEMVLGGKAVTVSVRPGGKVTTTPTGSPVGQGARSDSTSSGNAGTTVQPNYTPGATGAYPDANAAAVADMLSSAIPGIGLTNTLYKGAKALTNGSDPLSASNMGPIGDAFGGDPGPQSGYQPDRYKGRAQQTGLGAAEGDSSGERDIAGRPYGAGTMALTGDPADPISGGDGGYSDEVMLRDRRKPRATGAGTQMLLA